MASAGAWLLSRATSGSRCARRSRSAVEQLKRECDVAPGPAPRRAERARTCGRCSAPPSTFRDRYLRTETLVDFYSHAVNTRTSPQLGATLRACDLIARRSMDLVLEPLGRTARAC